MNLDVGTVGVWLLIVSALAILLECVLAAAWSARIARGATALRSRLQAEQVQIRADIDRLLAALAEMQVLWQPYARLLRWLRHPLAIALMQSYGRRRRSVVR